MASPPRPPSPDADAPPPWEQHFATAWLRHAAVVEAQLAPVDDLLLGVAAPRAGENVLDVGCGCGATAARIAARVGEGGSVTGVDIAGPLLVEAARRYGDRHGAHLEWIRADAERDDIPNGPFDLLVSRFGTLFFADPETAFLHLRHEVVPGGRLALAVWAPRDASEVMERPLRVGLAAARAHGIEIDVPGPDEGPLALGADGALEAVLAAAGWGDVVVTSFEIDLHLGGPGCALATAIDMWFDLGTLSFLADTPPEVRATVTTAVAEDLRPTHDGTGHALRASLRIATATNPAHQED